MASRGFFRPSFSWAGGTTIVDIHDRGRGSSLQSFQKRQTCFVLTYLVCWLPSFVMVAILFMQGRGDFVKVEQARNFSKMFFQNKS